MKILGFVNSARVGIFHQWDRVQLVELCRCRKKNFGKSTVLVLFFPFFFRIVKVVFFVKEKSYDEG